MIQIGETPNMEMATMVAQQLRAHCAKITAHIQRKLEGHVPERAGFAQQVVYLFILYLYILSIFTFTR